MGFLNRKKNKTTSQTPATENAQTPIAEPNLETTQDAQPISELEAAKYHLLWMKYNSRVKAGEEADGLLVELNETWHKIKDNLPERFKSVNPPAILLERADVATFYMTHKEREESIERHKNWDQGNAFDKYEEAEASEQEDADEQIAPATDSDLDTDEPKGEIEEEGIAIVDAVVDVPEDQGPLAINTLEAPVNDETEANEAPEVAGDMKRDPDEDGLESLFEDTGDAFDDTGDAFEDEGEASDETPEEPLEDAEPVEDTESDTESNTASQDSGGIPQENDEHGLESLFETSPEASEGAQEASEDTHEDAEPVEATEEEPGLESLFDEPLSYESLIDDDIEDVEEVNEDK